MKERFLYTPPLSDSSALSCITLPDGRTLSLPPEQASLGEAFLQPSLIGLDASFTPVHICALRALAKCSPVVKHSISKSAVALCGGHALTPGLGDRLAREFGLRVLKSPTASLDPWIGGSIICSLGCWNKVHVTREEFAEAGATALRMFSVPGPEV